MAAIPPPQGMNDADYDAIEEAVTETVRGRWFLNEFARRNRLAETRQLLDAMGRLEAAVFTNQTALPSADPSVRLLIQRIKEIATQLGAVVSDMRDAGIDRRYVDAVDAQARAVIGMMRGPQLGKAELPPGSAGAPSRIEARPASSMPPVPQVSGGGLPGVTPPAAKPHVERREAPPPAKPSAVDPRLAALSRLDQMSPAEKLVLFT